MIRALVEEGREIPPELEIEVPEAGEVYWAAFWWLQRRRKYTSGMAVIPLPLETSEITTYAAAMGLDVEETMHLVDRMDIEWLTLDDAKRRAASKVPAK